MRATLRLAALTALLVGCPAPRPAAAQQNASRRPRRSSAAHSRPANWSREGHQFFGTVSRGLAQVIEAAVSRWGQPNGYVLGQEGGGAFVVGLRYGDGKLYTKNAGDRRVFWEGPSIGFDTGGEGARTMMLVYNLPATEAIYQRFAGIDGSAYFIGGFGMTALDRQQHRRGADPLRRRAAARRQYRLSQVHPAGDLESVLTPRRLLHFRTFTGTVFTATLTLALGRSVPSGIGARVDSLMFNGA